MTGLRGEIEKIGSYAKGSTVTRADIDAVADRCWRQRCLI